MTDSETSGIILVKHYLCVVCKMSEIIERIIEHPNTGDIADQSNCNLSSYSGHQIVNGKLLKNRLPQMWERLASLQLRDEVVTKPPFGGICANCLKDETVKALADAGHINFATPEDFRH
jgi:hypothetical protein